MSKEIREVEFVLENCEVVIVPLKHFKKISINNVPLDELEDDSIIKYMECEINYGDNIRYSFTWKSNKTHPLERLVKYDDICGVHIKYEDDTIMKLKVKWRGGDCNNSNLNQDSYKVDYNTIHIKIEPYVEKFGIAELFNFTTGIKFRGENGNLYTLAENENGMYIDGANIISEELIKMEYELINEYLE